MTQSLASTGLGPVSSAGCESAAMGGVRPTTADPAGFLAAMNALSGGEGNLEQAGSEPSLVGAVIIQATSVPKRQETLPKSGEVATAVSNAKDESLGAAGLGLGPQRVGGVREAGKLDASAGLGLTRIDRSTSSQGIPSHPVVARGLGPESRCERAVGRRVCLGTMTEPSDSDRAPQASVGEGTSVRLGTSETELCVDPIGGVVPIVSLLENGTLEAGVTEAVLAKTSQAGVVFKPSAAEPRSLAAVGERRGRSLVAEEPGPTRAVGREDKSQGLTRVGASGLGWARVTMEAVTRGVDGGALGEGVTDGGSGLAELATGGGEVRSLGAVSAFGPMKLETSKIQYSNQVIRGSVGAGGERQEVPSERLNGGGEEVEKFLAPDSSEVDRPVGMTAAEVSTDSISPQSKVNKSLVMNELTGFKMTDGPRGEDAAGGRERMIVSGGTPGAQGEVLMKKLDPGLGEKRVSEGVRDDGRVGRSAAEAWGAVEGGIRGVRSLVVSESDRLSSGRGEIESGRMIGVGNEGAAAWGARDSGDLVVAGSLTSNASREATSAGSVSLGDRVERVEQLLTREMASFRDRALEPVSIVLRPDTNTELRLDLRSEGGMLRAEVTLERGDLRLIGGDWEQLQARFEERGIRLAALTTEPGLGSGSGGFGSMPERRDASARSDREWAEDGAFGAQRRANTAASGAALVGTASAAVSVESNRGRGTRWESWA